MSPMQARPVTGSSPGDVAVSARASRIHQCGYPVGADAMRGSGRSGLRPLAVHLGRHVVRQDAADPTLYLAFSECNTTRSFLAISASKSVSDDWAGYRRRHQARPSTREPLNACGGTTALAPPLSYRGLIATGTKLVFKTNAGSSCSTP